MMSLLASGRRLAGFSWTEGGADRRSPLRLVALLGAALGVRLVFFGGLLGWDDIEYWEAARALGAGHYVPTSSFGLRYTLTVPLALGQAWLGEHEWVLSLVPLAYSMAHLGLAWALGLLCGGRTVATVAVALLAILPLDVIAATDLHADLPLAVFLATAVYAVLRGERATRRRWAWFLLAGVALGLGVITKEVALALLAALALRRFGMPGRVDVAAYGWLVGGLLSVTVVEMVWLAVVTGNPLYRYLGPIAGLHAATVRPLPPGYGWMLGYPGMLLNPLSGSFGYFAGVVYLVVAGTIWGLRQRASLVAQLGIWWGVLLALFNFAPLDPSFTRPLFHHFARTLHPLLIPFVLTAALWIRQGLHERRRRRLLVLAPVLVLAALGIVITHADHRSWGAVAREAAPVIDRLPPETTIVTDPVNASLLRFFLPARRDRILTERHAATAAAEGCVIALTDPVFAHDEPAGLSPSPAWDRLVRFDRRPRPSLRAMLHPLLSRRPADAVDAPPMEASLWQVDRSGCGSR